MKNKQKIKTYNYKINLPITANRQPRRLSKTKKRCLRVLLLSKLKKRRYINIKKKKLFYL